MSDDIPPTQHSKPFTGFVISLVAVLAAIFLPLAVYRNLHVNPRTDDAQIRANVVGVAAQVSGAIVGLPVVDNQIVHRGDLLMELDPRPFAAEVEKAKAQLELTNLEILADKDKIASSEATLKEREARAIYADSYAQRVSALLEKRYVTPDKVELAKTDAEAAKSLVEAARATLAQARNLVGEKDGVNVRREAAEAMLRDANLKLSYCKVYAPCDGYITNLQITPGAYAKAGEQIFSLVDRKIWFVLANFRETDVQFIRPGMPADVFLLAQSGRKLKGIVQGVSKAIYPITGSSTGLAGGEGVLSRVQPTIDFILLAQRYPVRIILDEPEGSDFRMAGTAMVVVHTKRGTEAGEAVIKKLQAKELKPYEAPVHE
ncbi:MAG: HlyD family efflux transporter periplasmic adaptor subunit [Chthoniobacterales bacterium]